LGVVVTLYDKRTSLSEQVKSELEKHFGTKMFNTVIPSVMSAWQKRQVLVKQLLSMINGVKAQGLIKL
jgi:hypothetical protein